MKIALVAAALFFSGSAMAGPKLAITFDDLPAHGVLPAGVTRIEVAKEAIAAIKAAGLPPVPGMVNGSLIAAEPASEPVLKLWRDAGFPIGNHTFSHPNLAAMTTEAYEADAARNEPILAALGGDGHWFRYPFLSEGETPAKRAEFRGWLARHGYRIAPANVIVGDWNYPEPYARCLAKHDTAAIAHLEQMYLTVAGQAVDYARAASKVLNGRDVPYVLLLHIGAFQAHMLPQLITLYRHKGIDLVSLDEAEADPYYQAFTDPSLPPPPQDFATALKLKNLPDPRGPADQTNELAAMCK